MKALRSLLFTVTLSAVIYSVLFLVAIPVLCLSIYWQQLALFIISIIVIALGLPFIPLAWIQFSKLISLRRITATIEEEKVYAVDELAERLHLSRRCVCRRIRRILRRRILREYFFDGNLIHPNYRLGESKKEDGNS